MAAAQSFTAFVITLVITSCIHHTYAGPISPNATEVKDYWLRKVNETIEELRDTYMKVFARAFRIEFNSMQEISYDDSDFSKEFNKVNRQVAYNEDATINDDCKIAYDNIMNSYDRLKNEALECKRRYLEKIKYEVNSLTEKIKSFVEYVDLVKQKIDFCVAIDLLNTSDIKQLDCLNIVEYVDENLQIIEETQATFINEAQNINKMLEELNCQIRSCRITNFISLVAETYDPALLKVKQCLSELPHFNEPPTQ